MTSDNLKMPRASAVLSITPQERQRRDRVRLVRRWSKWLTRLDSMGADAAKMKRDGVTVPDAWGFAFADFFTLSAALRKYIMGALQSATGADAATLPTPAEPMPWKGSATK